MLNSGILYGADIAFVCFVRMAEQTEDLSLYRINRLGYSCNPGRVFSAPNGLHPYIKHVLRTYVLIIVI